MKKKLVILGLLGSLVLNVQADPPIENGKAIFSTRCATCHHVNKQLVGPALSGVDERRSMEWIIKFVQSSQTLIKTGDEQASAVFAKFNSFPMPDHPDLTADKIRDIVAFIKSETKSTPVSSAPFSRPGRLRPAYIPVRADNYIFFGGLFGAISLLVVALLMFVRVKELQRNTTNTLAATIRD